MGCWSSKNSETESDSRANNEPEEAKVYSWDNRREKNEKIDKHKFKVENIIGEENAVYRK